MEISGILTAILVGLIIGALGRLAHENHLFTDLDAAVAHARRHVERSTADHRGLAATAD